MRPRLLVMEGFGAFRRRVEVDFTDAELFSIVGPTGSGKSTILDAMVFALYGKVPRYGSSTALDPLVSHGASRALVHFEFEVGSTTYTATRLVKRQAGRGARVAEARLESGSQVLAAKVSEMGEQTQQLLGLDYSQFTKCVLLPQGEFARFLHDRPAERQKLIQRLLDFDVYESVGSLARERVREEDEKLRAMEARLEELSAGDFDLDAARRRVEDLAGVLEQISSGHRELLELRTRRDELLERRSRLETRLKIVETVEVPRDVAELGTALAEVEAELEAAQAESERLEEVVSARQARLRELPDQSVLQMLADAGDELKSLHEQVEELEHEIAEREKASREAAAELEHAKEEWSRLERELEEARRRHVVADLVSGLSPGDPCPVCRRPLETLPEVSGESLRDAERKLDMADRHRREAEAAWRNADKELASARARLEELKAREQALAAKLVDAPKPDEITRYLEARRVAHEELERTEASRLAARDRVRKAQGRLQKLGKLRRALLESLFAARQRLAELDPPAPAEVDDVVGGWKLLEAWLPRAASQLGQEISLVSQELEELDRLIEEREETLRGLAKKHGVDCPPGQDVRDVVLRAEAAARRDLEEATRRAERARDIERARRKVSSRRDLLSSVVDLLRADRFPAWLLGTAMEELVGAASERLRELSSGRYSLELAQGTSKFEIEVTDHANADLARPVRSLSGGETFMAALSLALALADRVAALSRDRGARVGSLFVDEGFGTLDSESMDVVASTVEELGSGDRTIGVVTHVRELAERLPVRFEVRREGTTAVVRRIEL